MESIVDGIMEAQVRLLKEHIRANCVIVDHKYVQLKKRLTIGICDGIMVVPPWQLGWLYLGGYVNHRYWRKDDERKG